MFVQQLQKTYHDRVHLYPHSDTEDVIEQTHAEMLAEHFLANVAED